MLKQSILFPISYYTQFVEKSNVSPLWTGISAAIAMVGYKAIMSIKIANIFLVIIYPCEI